MVVASDHYSYKYSSLLNPVAKVKPGASVTFQTLDASTNTTREDGDVTFIPVDRVNPATGPVWVEGCEPGDLLKIGIGRIKLQDLVHIKLVEGLGACNSQVKTPLTRVFKIRDNAVLFKEGIRIPIRPMVGVVATAPPGEPEPTVVGGDFGGNLDNNLITTGSTIYLPVYHSGARLFVGDLHASMGDGELCGLALEASGEVEVELDVVKNKSFPCPSGETGDRVFVCGFYRTDPMDVIERVSWNFVRLMQDRFGLTNEEAVMLISAAADFRFSQIAPHGEGIAARLEIAKDIVGMKKGESLF